MAEEKVNSVDSDEGALTEDIATVLFNEIQQGYREWSLDDKKFRTRFPTPKEDAEGRMVYARAFNEALSKDLPTQKQMRETLKNKGIWTDADEKEIEDLRQKINSLEVILSKKSPKDTSKTTRKLAEELLEHRAASMDKQGQLSQFLSQTIESIAEEERQAYYISTCTEREDGSKVWLTPEEFMNSQDSLLIQSATYEYVTYTNGLAENYIDMLPEVQFMKAGKE